MSRPMQIVVVCLATQVAMQLFFVMLAKSKSGQQTIDNSAQATAAQQRQDVIDNGGSVIYQ